MTHDTRSLPSGAPASTAPGLSTGPTVLSRSPFERLNGPEANAALQDVYERAHRTTGVLLVGHAIFAIAVFSAKGRTGLGIAWAAAIAAGFIAAIVFARASMASRQAAAFSLFGFVALQAFGLPGSLVVQGLFFATLAMLVIYQDPHCLWPAATLTLIGYLIVNLMPANAGGGNAAATELAGSAGVAAAAMAICTLCSHNMRKASLGSLRKQAVLTSENARITAELEKTRQASLETGQPDFFGGSRSGLSRTFASHDPATSASRVTEERYRMIIETAFDAIVIIDADTGLIVDLNPRALEMLGRAAAEVLGHEHVILFPPSKAPVYRALFRRAAKGELRTLEIELADRNGAIIPSEVAFSVSRLPRQRLVQGVFRDLTERKRSEAEKSAITSRLQEAQRLESLNVLAGGIAHDFNNILMSILGFATIGRDRSANSPTIASYFAKIESSTLRAGELCRQMLAFAGRAQVSIHQGDLNDVIRSFEEPLRNKLPGHIQLEMSLWPELPPVSFDTAQLGQVVVSLVTNATEAIADSPGLIQIKTFGSFPDDPTRVDGFITPEIPGDYCAVVEVTDTGCGINPEQMRRIFEPFYSTKFIGRGLGLSETLGMIRSHKGAIQVRSKRGEGATFRLYFPAIPTLHVMESTRAATPPPKRSPADKPELALVMDDEETIRDLVGSMLEEAGFGVRYAKNGTEGLELFTELAQQVSLVMLDLAMPGVPSHYVLEKIRAARKNEVRVFIMSGYSEGDALERCGNHRPDGFLAKPFSATHLKTALGI
ncbi:MAG TPA: PAS domain S-box protein [Opitutaceae bacterium]|nr:PAS domain S-box protein [Opitutaceae bacterium]